MKKRVVLALLLCFSMAFGMSGCGIGSAIMKAEEIAEQKAEEEVKEEIEDLPEEIIEEEVEEIEEVIEEVEEEIEEEVEEKDNKKPLKAPTSGTLSDDIYDFQISIDGFVYQIPVLYEDMVANGYSCEDDEDELPSMNYSLADVVKFGGSKMYVQFMNFDINSAPKKDGYIVQMSIEADELDDNNEVVLAQGIKLNESTYDDIKAAYGDASDVYEGSIYNKYTYKKDIYSDIDLYCDLETGKLIEIEMQNIVEPEDFVTSEISDEVPEIVGSYEAPTKMSDNALDYIVEYDGDMYQLPCPVSVFEENGWKVVEDSSEEFIEGSGSGKVTLMRNNQSFWTYVRNYDKGATAVSNCFVQDIEANIYECDVDMNIAGIKKGMSEDDFIKLIDKAGYEYETEDSSSYTGYSIKDDRSLTYHVDIICRDGIITGLSCQYDPRLNEYLESKGLK